jgi:GNAT superfamily N-acetyltransferase
MRIRTARPEDVTLLGPIAWAAKASWGYASDQLQAWREELTPTQASVLGQPIFVGELDGALAGFCQLDMRVAPVELAHMWVHPRRMRQGVGRALLVHAQVFLAGAGVPSLHIDSDPNAAPFYRACGAACAGDRASPLPGQPDRTRPQLLLATALPATGHADRT